jgi:hypothetical protein
MTQAPDRPLITLDFDGVICAPILGLNLGISAEFLDPDAEPRPARVPPHWVSVPADYLRFNFRRPLPGVAEALRALHEIREVAVLTGRRTSPLPWLRRYGLDAFMDRVIINDSALRSPHFKLRTVQALHPREHVDDDGRTAQLIAECTSTRVYLCDWPRNRRDGYASTVTKVASLGQIAAGLIQ